MCRNTPCTNKNLAFFLWANAIREKSGGRRMWQSMGFRLRLQPFKYAHLSMHWAHVIWFRHRYRKEKRTRKVWNTCKSLWFLYLQKSVKKIWMQNNRRPSFNRPSAVKYIVWRAARPLPLDKFKYAKRSEVKPGIRVYNSAAHLRVWLSFHGKFNILMSRVFRILPI